jgi:hypothetical protein
MRRASEPESRGRLLKRRAVSWMISFVILALFPPSAAAAETNRVLMLFSNDSLLPAGNAISSSFRSSLDAENPDRFEVFTEFLDADRFPGRAHEALGLRAPIVFITGRGDIPTSVRATKGGAVEFLTKPVRDGQVAPDVAGKGSFVDRSAASSPRAGLAAHATDGCPRRALVASTAKRQPRSKWAAR